MANNKWVEVEARSIDDAIKAGLNELNLDDAKQLTDNGCYVVAEGANMPSTTNPVHHFINQKCRLRNR